MGRRKKEPPAVHRENIASAASVLFEKKGITATSMDDIAKAAGYSKATLYVYFQNKEEIVGLLVLESMKKLRDYIAAALEQQQTTKARYDLICSSLVRYQKEFPFYFSLVLDNININVETNDCLPEEKKTYQVGENINEIIKDFLIDGIKTGDLRDDIQILPTIFHFWGMLAGLIRLAVSKEAYIQTTMQLSKEQFLQNGFRMLYRSIANREDNDE